VDRWLLLRGLGREAGHWHDFPEHLAAALAVPRAWVVALDLPGFGVAAHRTAPWTVAETVDDLRSRWHVGGGPEGAASVLGVSLGGMVALEWAARFPADFHNLVVLNPSDRRTARPHQRLDWRSVPLMLRIAGCRDLAFREELSLRLTTSRPDDGQRQAILREREAIARQRPVSRVAVLRQLVASARWAAPPRVEVPALVLVGASDRMVHPICSERLARRLTASLVRHPWGGHDLTVDDPEWVADEVATWIRDREPRPSEFGSA
jgi:pimeloyl-ACP methyl ester carboxylesterase